MRNFAENIRQNQQNQKNMFISKNQIKQIKSLQIKKNREQSSQFIAEGSKIVLDLIAKMELILIVITEKELETFLAYFRKEFEEFTDYIFDKYYSY